MVCNGCHKALGGGLAVGATGEFRVPSPAELLAGTALPSGSAAGGGSPAVDDTDAPDVGERVHSVNVCSWCGKLESQVKKLLGRGGVALCDECVSLASDILDAELGDTWR